MNKENKAIKDKITKYIRKFFELENEEEDYYEPVKIDNFWSHNYIEYESNGDKNKTPSIEEYLNKTTPYLIINDLKKFDIWKIQLMTAINFMSTKDNYYTYNVEIMINDKADEVIKKRFQSLLSRYQIGLETSMKGSDCIFNCVHLLCYKCHKINLNCCGLYIDSIDWIKKKNTTINLIYENDNKPFQYAVAIPLNHEKNPEKTSQIKPFIDKHNWEK